MAGAGRAFVVLPVIATLLCSTGAQAFCFSFSFGSDNRRPPYRGYVPPYPPPHPAMYSQGVQPMYMPGVPHSPVYPVPQPYGPVLPVQPVK